MVAALASPRVPEQKYSPWVAIQRCVFIMAAKVLLLFNYRQISCKIQPPTGRNSCRSSCSGRRARGAEPCCAASSSASFAPTLRGSWATHRGVPWVLMACPQLGQCWAKLSQAVSIHR